MIRICVCILIVPVISIIVKDPPEEYNYSYDIQDPTTGDTKSQYEVRKGDTVTGSYSLLDPDGTRRTVKYSADPINGFQATIHTEPAYNFEYRNPQPLTESVADKFRSKLVDRVYNPLHTSASPSSPYELIQERFFVPENELVPENRGFGYDEYFKPERKSYN